MSLHGGRPMFNRFFSQTDPASLSPFERSEALKELAKIAQEVAAKGEQLSAAAKDKSPTTIDYVKAMVVNEINTILKKHINLYNRKIPNSAYDEALAINMLLGNIY